MKNRARDFLSTAVGLQKRGKHRLSTEFWVRVLSYRKLIDEEIAECNLHYNNNKELLLEIHKTRKNVKDVQEMFGVKIMQVCKRCGHFGFWENPKVCPKCWYGMKTTNLGEIHGKNALCV